MSAHGDTGNHLQPAERIEHTSPTTNPATLNQKVKSCILCQQRKVKCDRKSPCSVCTRARVECIFRAPVRPRRRTKKIPEVELHARLRKYEDLLNANGIKVDSYEEDDSFDTEGHHPETVIPAGPEKKPTASPLGETKRQNSPPETQRGRLIVGHGVTRYLDNNLWNDISEELRERDMPQPNDDIAPPNEAKDNTIYSSLNSLDTDVLHPETDMFRFGQPRPNKSLASLHPQPVNIFRLWQTFLDNVNPLTKIIHTPTAQQQILEASGHVDNLSKRMESLMFAIYACAVNSMTDDECEALLGEARLSVLNRYRFAAWQSLFSAAFIKASDTMLLQAYTLYLLSVTGHYDPRSMWILTGVAVRIGQRMGLHRDGTSLGLSVFDVEMRRRLWWQIMLLDGRAAQLAGTEFTALDRLTDSRAPLNVNDSDLYPNMKEPPVEYTGVTEMVFILMRCEIGNYLHRTTGDKYHGTGLEKLSDPAFPLAEKDKVIDQLGSILEGKFLKYLDPVLPVHLLCTIVGNVAVSKMKLAAHHPRQYKDKGASLPQREKDMLLEASLKMLEWDNRQSDKIVQRFLWHIKNHFQFDALLYLLVELRTCSTGSLPDRAWPAINKAFENHPDMMTASKNALHVAIRRLTLKAWEAREAAFPPQLQPERPHPFPLVSVLRSTTQISPNKAPMDPQSADHTSLLQSTATTEQYLPGDHDENLEFNLGMNLEADDQQIELSQFDWVDWDSLLQDYDVPPSMD